VHRLGHHAQRAIEALRLDLELLAHEAELVFIEVSQLERRNATGIEAETFAHEKIVPRLIGVVKKRASWDVRATTPPAFQNGMSS
jgi:hypothetical protein